MVMVKELKESKRKAQGCKKPPTTEKPDIDLVPQKQLTWWGSSEGRASE